MNLIEQPPFSKHSNLNRIIGTHGDSNSDTLIICVGAMHGNEPAGVIALEKVFEHLNQTLPRLSAYFIGLRGNLRAIYQNTRYIHEDFNRIWSPANIQLARKGRETAIHTQHDEIQELAEMFDILDQIDFKSYPQKFFIDLHTTSALGGTFIVPIETTPFPDLLTHLRVPVIDNLVEKLEGTAVMYMHHQGFLAFAFEGGQHNSSKAQLNLEWAIWQTLFLKGGLEKSYIPKSLSQYFPDTQNPDIPKRLKLKYLHKVKPSDNFEMLPDFHNFQMIKSGQILARNRQGNITAPCTGYLLMPLYQKEGDDGFFIVAMD